MLLVLSLAALVEFAGVAAATLNVKEIGEASLFGRSGTIAVTAAAGVIVFASAIAAWRRMGGTVRVVAAVLTYVASGLVLVLIISLVTSESDTLGFAIVLAPAELIALVVGQAALRTPAGGR
jgi:hypothetical protein